MSPQNNLIKAVIIDDEVNSCDIIRLLLHYYCPEIEVTGIAYSCEKGIELIEQQHPQLVFLDLELQDGSGTRILADVDDPDFEVIFVTAYEKRFLFAIRFSELELILKPIAKEALLEAINNAEQKITAGTNPAHYQVLLYNLSVENNDYKILLPAADGEQIALLSSVISLQQEDNITTFYLDNKHVSVNRSFKYYTELLDDLGFFQVNNIQMINLKRFERLDNIHNEIIMDNGMIIPVSPRRSRELQLQIEKRNL